MGKCPKCKEELISCVSNIKGTTSYIHWIASDGKIETEEEGFYQDDEIEKFVCGNCGKVLTVDSGELIHILSDVKNIKNGLINNDAQS